MIVYRIANEPYKDDISGNGAAMYGSRWNSIGRKMLYTSQYISLSILESLVHLQKNTIPDSQYLLTIDIPETSFIEVSSKKIKHNWKNALEYTRYMGDQFLHANKMLVLKVPSVIIPEENNLLINPLHKDFKKIKLLSYRLLELDKRLHPERE